MKIFIMTDLEGATGVVGNFSDIFPGGQLHESAKKFLTGDVNAAIEGIIEVNVEEIVVLDGHGGKYSIVLEDLNPRAQLIWGRRILELEGLNESFDLMFIIGAHSMAGTPQAILPHTIGDYYNVWLNGKRVGEIGLWSALAGHYNVPVGLVTGDLAAVRESEELLGKIETVAVKEATSEFAAKCLHPKVTRGLIKEAAKRAVIRAEEFHPYRPETPIELTVEYLQTHMVDRISKRQGVVSRDGRTITLRGDNILELYKKLLL